MDISVEFLGIQFIQIFQSTTHRKRIWNFSSFDLRLLLNLIFFVHRLFLTKKFLLYFLVADHGKIIKAVNAESADSNKKVSSVVIEELDVLPTNEPIRNLEIIRTTQYGK